jgi:hypothetical protein
MTDEAALWVHNGEGLQWDPNTETWTAFAPTDAIDTAPIWQHVALDLQWDPNTQTWSPITSTSEPLTLTSINPTTGTVLVTAPLDLHGTGFMQEWVDNDTPFMQVTYDGPEGPGRMVGSSITFHDSTYVTVPDFYPQLSGAYEIYMQTFAANNAGGDLIAESAKLPFTVP